MCADHPFLLLCPTCRSPLETAGTDVMHCRNRHRWGMRDGVWHLLREPERTEQHEALARYRAVRSREGWGGADAEYYRALPFADRSGQFPDIWRIRAQSYRALCRRVIAPLGRTRGRALRVIDAGAGNGWMSARLARDGHCVAALDVSTDERDGLGALGNHAVDVRLLALEAAYEHMPLADAQADLVVFNGSLHHSREPTAALREALRVLDADGRIVILDTPWYRRAADGQVRTMSTLEHGPGSARPLGFLTPGRLQSLCQSVGLRSRIVRPPATWRAAAAAVRSRLLGRAARAGFPVLVLAAARAAFPGRLTADSEHAVP